MIRAIPTSEARMALSYFRRSAALMALALAVSPAAMGQSQRIEDVNKDVFRGLQYLGTTRPSHNWTAGDAAMMMRAIMKDLAYDDAERALVAALRQETFDLVIAASRAPDFNPADLIRKGTLPADARMQLSAGLAPADFAAERDRQKKAAALETAPAPGETEIAFFMRTGRDGFARLVTYANSGPEAWREARSALLAEFRTALADALAKDRGITDRARISVEIGLEVRDAVRSRFLDALASPEGRLLVLEAGALLDHEQKGARLFEAFFWDLLGDDDQARRTLATVSQRIGISPDDL
jgi:hypothetical protein